jgi:hypothetical protein
MLAAEGASVARDPVPPHVLKLAIEEGTKRSLELGARSQLRQE